MKGQGDAISEQKVGITRIGPVLPSMAFVTESGSDQVKLCEVKSTSDIVRFKSNRYS